MTAVDFSATALAHARSTAEALGQDVAGRIEWVEGDLGSWTPPLGLFDLVSCLYVHVAGSVGEMVARLASGVAPGGTLLMVGHRPVDPATGAPTPAAGQVQVTSTTSFRLSTAVGVVSPRSVVVPRPARRRCVVRARTSAPQPA